MLSDHPKITRGTRWNQTQATQWQNLMRTAEQVQRFTVGKGLRKRQVSGGLLIELAPDRERRQRPQVVQPYRLIELGADWLHCEPEGGGPLRYILKPWELRRSSFENVVRNEIHYIYDEERLDRRMATWMHDPIHIWQWEIVCQPYVAKTDDYDGDVIVVVPHAPVSVQVPNPADPGGATVALDVGLIDWNFAAREFVREADLELEISG